MLLREGQDAATVNRRYFSTALHLACEAGNVDCAETLLNAKCGLHVKDTHGRHAIHYAAAADFDCAKLLIAWKAEIDPRDNDGLSPLDYTFDEDTGKMLRKHGAALSLFGSVQGGHADRVRLLIKQGASLTETKTGEDSRTHRFGERRGWRASSAPGCG